LRSCIEEAALSIKGNLITPLDLPLAKSHYAKRHLLTSEKDWILDGLRRNRFRRTETALELGISRKTLYNKIQRYALDHDSKKPS
jgi:DNA-binding NtrC family response regulator